MANHRKYDRVRSRFICDQVKFLKEKGFNVYTVFDRCWSKIPDALTKKLNAEELSQYIRLHILPTEISSQTSRNKDDGYNTKNPKSHTVEKFA
ncbi:hypothetical protein LEP1GSC151_2782 [Leptospira interrogans serovar Grippotyphosa str. LT2186]|uniref:Uncharacterized protein n=1 Tax=Leptospira interrogans serovar Grippotyphosa str. LT2186 TaxID=1001599 RepID=M3HHL5_LEPIR|nr:hypothetical protein [Leptospira interrogans]EMG12130.1 hypothetical protein LEP1GSC151_2782 [Leptospira interrogans serovar Grippotyphosa str. LT2186]EMN54789.1 hypothetical protein LEP1GSC089_2052 [Leptospira interrogans serovar Autumnalis str. LP101]EMN83747.1 hypothetical protein LEP1GSC107_1244 [Leptospira interrogans serovar Grippotyphosa str. UI 12769]ENO71115.1 hypothetical protein LEP1GSC012_0717 [Leptospira interrogans serovar Valbuzzi str. Valbuzzi]MCR8647677.1 hypothetical prote